MAMTKIPFSEWWVLNVGRPPIAEEREIYQATAELFEYARGLEEELDECQDSLAEAMEMLDQ